MLSVGYGDGGFSEIISHHRTVRSMSSSTVAFERVTSPADVARQPRHESRERPDGDWRGSGAVLRDEHNIRVEQSAGGTTTVTEAQATSMNSRN